MREIGVYVHFPYCTAICPYCNFNVHLARDVPHRAYADAVLRELHMRLPSGEFALRSIYFGGGTPGLWHPSEVGRVIAEIRACFPGPDLPEVTAEVNPGDTPPGSFEALRNAGCNRLSIGVQSFGSRHLRRLGRLHDGAEARSAIDEARGAGYPSFNVDFLFGLEGQETAEWGETLEEIAALGAPHLSIYGLTVEGGTPLARRAKRGGAPLLPDDAVQADMMLLADERLTAAGYEHYEVSNYALAGHRAVHNSLYWRGREYLGLGAGAHGFLRRGAGGVRWENLRPPQAYLDACNAGRLPQNAFEPRTRFDVIREALLTGLRWLDGLDFHMFYADYGVDLTVSCADVLESLERDGLAREVTGRLRLTPKGLLFLDAITLRFFDAPGLSEGS